MRKKRKRKKRSIATDVKAIYQRGVQLYLEEENYIVALKYLFRAAKAGYKKAYGEIGIILYREKNETDKAEVWFRKAEKANLLFPVAAYEYGILFYLEKEDIKTSLKYLLQSAKQGCELAYGQIGIILYLEKNKINEEIGAVQSIVMAVSAGRVRAQFREARIKSKKSKKKEKLIILCDLIDRERLLGAFFQPFSLC